MYCSIYVWSQILNDKLINLKYKSIYHLTLHSCSVTDMNEHILEPYLYWGILELEYILLHFNYFFYFLITFSKWLLNNMHFWKGLTGLQ